MTRNDVPFGKGQCDIRLQVDNEAIITVQRDTVFIRTLSGREPFDDGSECNFPLPDRNLRGFGFEVKDQRGDIRLEEEPGFRNDFRAVVRIRDSAGGLGRYHFRLTWDAVDSGGRPGDRRDDRPGFDRPGDRREGPGFAWNSEVSFRGQGRGEAFISGGGAQRLFDCNVNIDRRGHIIVTFRAERGRTLAFSGQVVGREAGRLRADVMSDDRDLRVRGPMFISIDDRYRDVNSVSLEAAEGRDRLRLNWDRR